MSTKKLSQSEFIERCNDIHGDRYDYSSTTYVNSVTKIYVKCNSCKNNWEVMPGNHTGVKKSGCPHCKKIKHQNRMNKEILSQDDFLNRSRSIHNNKFDYSITKYKNSSTKIDIICPVHGLFKQWPQDHMRGIGCAQCSGVMKKTTRAFVNEAKSLFPHFDYSLVEYKNAHINVSIICPTHGVFKQKPNAILNNVGCKLCATSRMLNTKIEKGDIRAPEDIPEYESYRKAVWRISNQQYKLHKDIINPADLPRSLKYHLDHKYSIQQGWENDVPANIIGGYKNLQILEGRKNRQKGNKCECELSDILRE